MNRSLTLAAAAFGLAIAAPTLPASAGEGVRLGFGGPLPSFVATPSRGAYASGPSSSRAAAKAAIERKKQREIAAARRAESRKKAAALSNKGSSVPQKTVVKAAPAATTVHAEPAKAAEKAPETTETKTTTEETGLSGAQALARAASETNTTESTEPSENGAADETADEDAVVDTGGADNSETQTASDDASCRKFIPAIGVTVSVGCE